MRVFAPFAVATAMIVAPIAAFAQEDSIFTSYDDYATFVDDLVLKRDFIPLIQRRGGRDEYTIEQLNGIEAQFTSIYARAFDESAALKETELGAGFSSEIRSYWGPSGYLWFGALLHDRGDDLVVIHFRLNANSQPVFEQY